MRPVVIHAERAAIEPLFRKCVPQIHGSLFNLLAAPGRRCTPGLQQERARSPGGEGQPAVRHHIHLAGAHAPRRRGNMRAGTAKELIRSAGTALR